MYTGIPLRVKCTRTHTYTLRLFFTTVCIQCNPRLRIRDPYKNAGLVENRQISDKPLRDVSDVFSNIEKMKKISIRTQKMSWASVIFNFVAAAHICEPVVRVKVQSRGVKNNHRPSVIGE